ncbi:hypothetical protein Mapa_000747 [Marchantia paleacea]|nr:hypothetical protein Mapa_000747 [Marchantia paleacea]
MTMSAKEEALELLVRDQWLSRTREGGVSLGTRAFLELRGLFRNLEVPFCEVCNEAAIKAELCQNHECPVRMHSYCVGKKFRGRQARVCSRCQFEWIGAAAEDDDEEENMKGQIRKPNGSSRRVNTLREPAVSGNGGAVADTDDEEENIQRHTRRPAVNNGNSRRGSTFAEPAVSDNGRKQPARRSQYSTRNKSRVSGSPDNEENSEEEDQEEEEEITRLNSEEPEESPPPRKRRLLRKRG